MTTNKPPRTRTAYQTAIVREIRKFCPPKLKKGETPPTREQLAGWLLKPYETTLMPDGDVVVIWFAHKVVSTKKRIVWLNYSKIDETRVSNTAFGVFLDWCDERGLRYERASNHNLPNAKYRHPCEPGYHFCVTIPQQGA